ncbi:MAG: 2-oxo acid dehydrogenase subunit E2 [Planctomycetes bacterium]|nr:2-oxo acid dehydrogenase subunit E2 [Planctomycetota bacterium]
MYEFKLPDLGEGIHEGEILKWHAAPGSAVQEDDPLVDVETDKAALTIPSPKSGTIVSLGGAVGDTVRTGEVIVVIDDGSAAAAAAAPAPAAAEPAAAGGDGARQHAPPQGAVIAAHATRGRARELGIDIRLVPPSGPGGRVTTEDVERFARGEAAAEAVPAAPHRTAPAAAAAAASSHGIPFLDIEPLPDFSAWGKVEKVPLRSLRRKVARRLTTSMILVPHVAHIDEADVTRLEEIRLRERARRAGQPGEHLTLLPFVIKAATAALKEAPAFNASLDPFAEEIIYKRYYNVGVAADTERGLLVPVIRDTDKKSVMAIAAELEQIAQKARANEITVEELRGGTFTITNVGAIGGIAAIPTINYPEAAILGMGRLCEKPLVVDGAIVIRKVLPICLSFDHRIADGMAAARFVTSIIRRLSDPDLLLVEA